MEPWLKEIKASWLEHHPKFVEPILDKLLRKLRHYSQKELNAEGINALLLNIFIFSEMPSEISLGRQYLPKINDLLLRAENLSKNLKGDDSVDELRLKIKDALKAAIKVAGRYTFYDVEIVRKGKNTKRPPLTEVHGFEAVLISYFFNTKYCSSITAAYKEVHELISLIGRNVTFQHVKETYEGIKKNKKIWSNIKRQLEAHFRFYSPKQNK